MRHAYGSMGNFLAGQTWTTFLNVAATWRRSRLITYRFHVDFPAETIFAYGTDGNCKKTR